MAKESDANMDGIADADAEMDALLAAEFGGIDVVQRTSASSSQAVDKDNEIDRSDSDDGIAE